MVSTRAAQSPVGDRGSITAETMIVIPVLILVLLLGVAAARVTIATAAVAAAARDASRQASIARTATAAHEQAMRSALATLQDRSLPCGNTDVHVDAAGFVVRPGTPAVVSASVRCTVSLADLTGLPGLPGTVVKTARFTSPLDPYRGRQ